MLKLTEEILADFQEAYRKDTGILLPLSEIEAKVRQFAEVVRILTTPISRDAFLLWWEQEHIGTREEGLAFLATRTKPIYKHHP